MMGRGENSSPFGSDHLKFFPSSVREKFLKGDFVNVYN